MTLRPVSGGGEPIENRTDPAGAPASHLEEGGDALFLEWMGEGEVPAGLFEDDPKMLGRERGDLDLPVREPHAPQAGQVPGMVHLGSDEDAEPRATEVAEETLHCRPRAGEVVETENAGVRLDGEAEGVPELAVVPALYRDLGVHFGEAEDHVPEAADEQELFN